MYNSTKPYKHKILSLIEATWDSPYIKIKRGLYPTFERNFAFREVQHTDGIGTKGFYHWRKKTFENAVLDALAMNLNDLAMIGATPYALQNHIVLPKDDHEAILSILNALVKECRKRNIAITGGETSIHFDAPGMDISITVSGFIKKARENLCKVNDVLIGIKSAGLHSNGMTKVREIFGQRHKEEFTVPTRIYWDEILRVYDIYSIHGMMHITGGAFSKLKDIVGKTDIVIHQPKELYPHDIFWQIYKSGVSDKVMYSTFNCGIGFILSVPKREAVKILQEVKDTALIGEVVQGSGRIQIKSAFSSKIVYL